MRVGMDHTTVQYLPREEEVAVGVVKKVDSTNGSRFVFTLVRGKIVQTLVYWKFFQRKLASSIARNESSGVGDVSETLIFIRIEERNAQNPLSKLHLLLNGSRGNIRYKVAECDPPVQCY